MNSSVIVSSISPQGITDINCSNISNQIFYWTTCSLGVLLNVALYLIINYKTTTELKQYSLVLRISCLIDIYSSFTQVMTMPRPIRLGQENLLTINLDGVLPRLVADTGLFKDGNLNYILFPEYIGCYVSVSYCSAPFIYRYLLMCWNRQMKNSELFLVLFILGCLAVCTSVSTLHASASIYETNIHRVPSFNDNCIRFLPQFSSTRNLDNEYSMFYFTIFYYCTLTIMSTYLITFFCACRIHFFLKKQFNITSVQKRIQHQVSRTLAIQAIAPLVVFFGPTVIIIILISLEMTPTFVMRHYLDMYTFIPIINAISVFTLIGTYKIALLNVVVELSIIVGNRIGSDWRESRFAKWVKRYADSDGSPQGGSKVTPVP